MIKQVEYHDLQSVMALCRIVTQALTNEGIYQWDTVYPNLDTFISDIADGGLFGYFKGGKILGLIVLNKKQEPEYQAIDWQIKTEKVGVIHRLMVHPKAQKKGIASKLLSFAETSAVMADNVAIRLDVFSENKRAISFNEKRGYQKAGTMMYRKGPFYGMEKHIAIKP